MDGRGSGSCSQIAAHLRALFGGRQLGREAHDDARGLQARRRLHHGLVGIRAGDHHQFHVLARLFRQGDHVGEDLCLIFGLKICSAFEAVFAGARLCDLAHREHHDVHLARVGLRQDALPGAASDCGLRTATRTLPGRTLTALCRNVRAGVQAELLQVLLVGGLALAVVDVGSFENDEEDDGENDAGDGGHLLGEHVDDGQGEQRHRDHHQAQREFRLRRCGN